MKILEFLKKHWRAAVLTLGALGLGLGTFNFFRRFHIKFIRADFREEEVIFKNVRLIQEYYIQDDAEELDHQQYLNIVFYPKYNLIILKNYFPRQIYEESYQVAEILNQEEAAAMSDEELVIPAVYCENANIKKITFVDGATLYVPEYNVDFEIIDEGDIDYDFYK